MPQIRNFNNKQVVEPGAYTRIVGGVPVPAITLTYGKVMVIDTGSGNGFVNGAGISGETASGNDVIYAFDDVLQAQTFLGGGILYDLMPYLFAPNLAGQGPQQVYFARAATTVAAKAVMSYNSAATSLQIVAKNEGPIGNGVLNSSFLTKGFGWKLIAGINNPAKFILQIFQGVYKGADSLGYAYDLSVNDIVKGKRINRVISSIEVSGTDELKAWMANDTTFNAAFKLGTTVGTNYAFQSSDITTAYQLFSGGTCTYSAAAMDSLLGQIEDLDNDAFLCDDYGIVTTPSGTDIQNGTNKGALSSFNAKILSYCVNTATDTEKSLYIGGGQNEAEFDVPAGTGTLQIAAAYNSELVSVMHGSVKLNAIQNYPTPTKDVPSLYTAALLCGRTNGLEPQVPVTYKDVRIAGVGHILKKKQREDALLAGVTHLKNVKRLGWVVNLGNNTMQTNNTNIYPDGSSPLIQHMRIIHQLNKELKEDLAVKFVGGNLKTASAAEVKASVENFLKSKTIQPGPDGDNLIYSFQNVTVVLQGTDWDIRYCFAINSEIDRLFATGTVIDPNISA